LSTLVAVYVLILVGSIVRSTGSGMGCPDWPKCFGSWFPPSSVKELPPNYKEIFASARTKKNIKFAHFLSAVGLNETASKLLTDETVTKEEDFSPLKSKIEYLNRVVGVIIGFMISLVLLHSFKFIKTKFILFIVASIAWLSVLFTGWFGSIVVSTNLTPWTVSVHLGFALLIVGLLIFLYHSTIERKNVDLPDFRILLRMCFVLLCIQMILGVQVRERLDQVAFLITNRADWMANLGLQFFIHRSFSWLVFIFNALLAYKWMKNFGYSWHTTGLVALTLGSVISGVGMAYRSVPAFLQPLHLLFSTLTFGILLFMIFQYRNAQHEAAHG
jgi:cytochrome c oxidase assembly protein subunit 15